MVLQTAQYTKFCSAFGIKVSEIIIIMSSGSVDSFEWTSPLVEFGNFWHKSVDQSSLEDQDKQRIRFFVIRFTVKYSDRLVATAALKVLNFQALRVLGHLTAACQCGFVRSSYNLSHLCSFLESLLHYPRQQCLRHHDRTEKSCTASTLHYLIQSLRKLS